MFLMARRGWAKVSAPAESAPFKKLPQDPTTLTLVTSRFISLAKPMSHDHPQLSVREARKRSQMIPLVPPIKTVYYYKRGKGRLDSGKKSNNLCYISYETNELN